MHTAVITAVHHDAAGLAVDLTITAPGLPTRTRTVDASGMTVEAFLAAERAELAGLDKNGPLVASLLELQKNGFAIAAVAA